MSVNGDVRVFWSYRASITDARMGFVDLVVTTEDLGIISRDETSVKNYSELPAVTSVYSGDAGQVLPTSE